MSKAQATALFKTEVLPGVQRAYEADGKPDWPARAEAWNDFTDVLCKDRAITPGQYDRWVAPACCVPRRDR